MTPGYMMGERGGEFVTGAASSLVVGGTVCRAIQVLEEATVTVLTVNLVDTAAVLPLTLAVGEYLFGAGVTAYTQTAELVYLIK